MTGRVTMADCAKLGFCALGVRRWMNAHGKDMRAFVREGMPVEEMEALNDAFGNRLVALVRERTSNEQA